MTHYVFDIPWTPRSSRANWPVRAGMVFILAAFSEVLDAFNGLTWDDLVDDPVWTSGSRAAVTDKFEEALMSGSLVASSQPTTGGDLRPIPATDWTREMVREMMETGFVALSRGRRTLDQWVFVNPAAVSLMTEVLSASDMLHGEHEYGPVERLGRRVLDNISRIAGDADRAIEIVRAEEIAGLSCLR